MPGRQLLDPSEHSVRWQWRPETEYLIQFCAINFPANPIIAKDCFDLGPEQQSLLSRFGIKERTHTQPIAREKEPALRAIPDRDAPLTVHAIQAGRSKLLVEMKDYLCVRRGAELMTTLLEFGAQFDVIEDFAVEYDPEALVLVRNRL